MELSDKEKNDLRRFSLILNSMNMEDGVYWNNRYEENYGYEQTEGPYYKNKNVESEISFLPDSIENFFKNILDNFDTDLFYNDYYDNYNGGVIITLNAIKKNLEVEYYYYSMNEEEHEINKSFVELSQITNQWRRGEEEVKKLADENFLNEMKNLYGSYVEITYDGSGDSGYINNDVESETGREELAASFEDIAYECLEIYFAGWEINEGSSGKMKFDFDNQTLSIYHYQNIEEENEEHYKTFSFS